MTIRSVGFRYLENANASPLTQLADVRKEILARSSDVCTQNRQTVDVVIVVVVMCRWNKYRDITSSSNSNTCDITLGIRQCISVRISKQRSVQPILQRGPAVLAPHCHKLHGVS